jgi:Ca2+-binding RTX toxin-like protein
MRLVPRRRATVALLASAGCVLALAPPALGVNVGVGAGTLTIAAAPGETNGIAVSYVGTFFAVDDAVPIVAGAGCTVDPGDATNATCTAVGVTAISISAGDGSDVLQVVGPVGASMSGGDGNDVIRGGDGADVLLGDNGDDTLESGLGADVLDGGAGNDTFEGLDGNDVLRGGPGNDTMSGGEGDDAIDGGDGADDVNGGNGSDWIDYGARVTPVNVNLTDTVRDGGVEDGWPASGDSLLEVENIRGGAAADVLRGNNVGNVLDGGAGADNLDGDTGSDVADYSSRTTPVTVDLGDAIPDGGSEDGAGDTLTSIEGVTGSQASDVLRGDGGDNTLNGAGSDDRLIGRAGADWLIGGAGADVADYSDRTNPVTADLDGAADDGEPGETDRIETDVEALLGGAGSDVLTGNNGPNTLSGGPGNDVLNGLLGADVLQGGAGTDSVSYAGRPTGVLVTLDDAANDGESGETDNVGADVENVTGGNGNDVLRGSSAANSLSGGPGNDLLDGGLGADVLSGGIGTDTVDYGSRSGNLTVDLDGQPDDGVTGENDNVTADVENVTGGSGNDVLKGGGGPNVLLGGAGADTLDALAGPDTINGGPGNDEIRAEDGVGDQIICGGGTDTIARDAIDNVSSDCENVTTGGDDDGRGFNANGRKKGGKKGLAIGESAELVLANGATLLVGADGKFRIKLRCPKKAKKVGCKGTIKLTTKAAGNKASAAKKKLAKKKAVKVGVAKYNFRRGKARWVNVKLTPKGRVLVKNVRKVKVVVISKGNRTKTRRLVRTVWLAQRKAVKV